mmetsp:Transcript_27513/g.40653  ORF Transcript_27513/g.40653 Transcript_27513/m.40653 type:complete len:181 (-) Transcript_27513:183-725(-)|eukprot:CAMPEP_0194218446 /NCGR_PEP_ID=MMETSP0156-20130528/23789_1 /TAXON_ID=33649 /ORGANISM="Thalassionema nitzschioides, Strain L26-B" /LENGTH=180 /DNA_ID=CAMNT_0038947805 /DNA_START=77 /DNA_END=619 /DNA_ORIENTATION=-
MTASPPPPPPPPSRPSVRPSIPHKCHPDVNALFLLGEKISSTLEKSETKSLLETELGQQLRQTFQQCRPYRNNYKNSKENFMKDTSNKELKQQVAKDELAYQSCLAAQACSHRWNLYVHCWSPLMENPKLLQDFQQAGMLHHLCERERRAVERCASQMVSTVIREADDQPGVSKDDTMAV